MNSRQILAIIDELKDKQVTAMADGNEAEAHRLQGIIDARNADLRDVCEAEANAAAGAKAAAAPKAQSITEQVFGARAEFKGVTEGTKGTAHVYNAVTGLVNPVGTDTELLPVAAKPCGFLATLEWGETNQSENYYTEPVFTNNAAAWSSGDKPESVLAFDDAVANLETVAHWVPIKKQNANRFDSLQDIVEGSLLYGLNIKNDYYALWGSNSSGIVGIANTTGVQEYEYTEAQQTDGVNIKDVIGRMALMCLMGSGMPATHVAISPAAVQALREAKDNNGQYLFPDIDRTGKIDGLEIVEDVNMQVVTTSGETTTVTEACLVYNNKSAKAKIADEAGIEIGVTGSQFIQNAYTVLAENTWLLKVPRPAAFVLCDDLLIEDSVSFM